MTSEAQFQKDLIKQWRKEHPNDIVFKTDPQQIQGFPDLIFLRGDRWGVLEVKKSAGSRYQPNQQYWLAVCDSMSFGETIYPDNKEEILDALEQALGSGREARDTIAVPTQLD